MTFRYVLMDMEYIMTRWHYDGDDLSHDTWTFSAKRRSPDRQWQLTMVLVQVLVTILSGQHSVTADYEQHQHPAPMSLLHELTIGEVIPCCGQRYEQLRKVNNQACVSRPRVIVLPVTTEDVAIAVNFARRNGLQVITRLRFKKIYLTSSI